MERQSRSNNIILFNLPEEDNHKDLENNKNMYSDLNKNILHFTFSCLGKINFLIFHLKQHSALMKFPQY